MSSSEDVRLSGRTAALYYVPTYQEYLSGCEMIMAKERVKGRALRIDFRNYFRL